MKNLVCRLSLLAFCLFLSFSPTSGKSNSPADHPPFPSHWNIRLSGGPSIFLGDLKEKPVLPVLQNENELRFGGGLSLEFIPFSVLGIHAQVLYSQLSGTRRWRAANFESELLEFNTSMSLNLSNLFAGYKPTRRLNFHVVGGIGLLNYNTNRYALGTDFIVDQRGHGNGSGISGMTLETVLLGGIGIDYRINDRLNLRFESANRILDSDQMDTQVGGFEFDIYNHTSIGISYTFHRKQLPIPPVRPDDFRQQQVTEQIELPTVAEIPKQQQVEPPEVGIPVIKPTPTLETAEVEAARWQPALMQVEYRVQIRANFKAPLNIEELSRRFNIP
ncbi:MAG TPA: hypothetical protein VLH16_02740, partial [Bacteroidales bacterium]|nr:hypothetical protein [Bacteroidales bacterium]